MSIMHELSWKRKQEYRGETAGHLFHYYTVTFEPPNSGGGNVSCTCAAGTTRSAGFVRNFMSVAPLVAC